MDNFNYLRPTNIFCYGCFPNPAATLPILIRVYLALFKKEKKTLKLAVMGLLVRQNLTGCLPRISIGMFTNLLGPKSRYTPMPIIWSPKLSIIFIYPV